MRRYLEGRGGGLGGVGRGFAPLARDGGKTELVEGSAELSFEEGAVGPTGGDKLDMPVLLGVGEGVGALDVGGVVEHRVRAVLKAGDLEEEEIVDGEAVC